MTTQVRYIGRHDEVFIPDVHLTITEQNADGSTTTRTVPDAVVKHGQTIEVPDDIAGKPPAGTPPSGTPGEPNHSPGVNWDPGSGLLAQTDNWEPAAPAPIPPASTAPTAPVSTPTPAPAPATAGEPVTDELGATAEGA